MDSVFSFLRIQEPSNGKPKSSSKELKHQRYENILVYLKEFNCEDEIKEIMKNENDKKNFINYIWNKVAVEGDIEILQELINNGMDIYIDEKDYYHGFTALMVTSSNNRLETVKLLLENSANINEKNNYGWTSLMWASVNGHLEVVKLLLENGANINEKSNKGGTALMYASEKGHLEIVKILLDKGADENIKNDDGNTAIELTESEEIKEFISNYNSTKFVLK